MTAQDDAAQAIEDAARELLQAAGVDPVMAAVIVIGPARYTRLTVGVRTLDER